MKPALAFPYNDPDGTMFPHLQNILPDLKEHFEHAYICPPLSTQKLTDSIKWLQADDFFTVFPLVKELRVGEHFAYLYQLAADGTPTEQPIHLCYLDRVSFALEGEYHESFLADIDSLSPKTLLVDGNNLLKIDFHGVRDFYHNGKHVGGVWHFLNTLRNS